MTHSQMTMTLAMSLDGYIARHDGSYDWIVGDGAHQADTPQRWDFAAFLADIDIVVMGRRSYEQGFHAEYAPKQVVVMTRTARPADGHVVFVHPDQVLAWLAAAAAQGRGRVYLFGGSQVIAHFIDLDAITDYYVGIVPVILGDGIRLFGQATRSLPLTLQQVMVDDGVVVLQYRRRQHHEGSEK